MTRTIRVKDVEFGAGNLVLVAGPCVLESLELGLEVAERTRDLCAGLGFGYVFKSSFDKANRTSITSYRGPGIEKGLEWLGTIGKRVGVPVLTDIHEPHQAALAAESVDILQIPAFLCRQTDLLVAAALTGRALNVKKAQFMAPEDMSAVLSKCAEAGNRDVILCERGSSFGYHQLVVDMRSLAVMRSLGVPVMFDATHSVQTPGGKGTTSGGDRRFVLPLARAAVAEFLAKGAAIEDRSGLAKLREPRGAFVTLTRDGELRGCIGFIAPVFPLGEAVIKAAVYAATEDPRFPPVRPGELADLDISVDVLTPPEPIQSMDQLDPQRYGVIVRCGWRRGLLLPDLEGVDSVEYQVDIARRKAGIGPREPVELYRFEVKRYH